jgi:hypothetical protein
MQTLLIVAVVVIALAVITQAGVLLAMYLLSRKVTDKIEGLMDESRRLMEPLESITGNLKAVSDDLSITGEIAREQALHIREIVNDMRETVLRPIREYSALALAIAEGVRTFFGGKQEEKIEIENKEERPAA